MPKYRFHTALVCLLSFALGGVAAPLSHFVFMAASDAYGMSEGQAHHHHHMGHVAGPQIGASVPAHLSCQYADLFATSVLDVAPTQAAFSPFQPQALLVLAPVAAPLETTAHLPAPRGPPRA